MGFVKCFDVASMIIDEVNNGLETGWRVDRYLQNAFEYDCNGIDALSREFNGSEVEVSVDESSLEITVSLVCDEVIFEDTSDRIYDVIRHAKRLAFGRLGNVNGVQITFVFPGIWENMNITEDSE